MDKPLTATWLSGVGIKRPEALTLNVKSFSLGGVVSRTQQEPGYQVFCEGDFIGWFNYQGAFQGNSLSIPILEMDDLSQLTRGAPHQAIKSPVSNRTIHLKCETMHRKLDELELALAQDREVVHSAFKQKHNIPTSAEISREPRDNSILYRWRVFVVSLDDSELLFDLPGFTPSPD